MTELELLYEDLKKASPEELLKAAAHFYREYDTRFAQGLDHAVFIIGVDGWQYLAPKWLREYRQSHMASP